MEHAGHLVLYPVSRNWWAMWNITETGKNSQLVNNRFLLREDGNLVMNNRRGQVVWQSGTKDGDHLDVQNNGYLILYNSNEEPVWVSPNFKSNF